jgi:hypothetical protein
MQIWTIISPDSGKKYAVTINDDSGYKSCNCPHWIHRLRVSGGNCKHINLALIRIEAQNWANNQPMNQWLFDLADDKIKLDTQEEA